MERVIDCPVCFDTDNCFEDMRIKKEIYIGIHL